MVINQVKKESTLKCVTMFEKLEFRREQVLDFWPLRLLEALVLVL